MSADRTVRLLGAGDVRALAARLGVRPTKKLGQNFVVEPGTVRQIAALAGPFAPDDVILEVGPGLGSLTLALLEAAVTGEAVGHGEGHVTAGSGDRAEPAGGARIVAVEIDPVLAGELPKTIADRAPTLADRVTVIQADALTVGPPTEGGPRAAQRASASEHLRGRRPADGAEERGLLPVQPGRGSGEPDVTAGSSEGSGAWGDWFVSPQVVAANLPYNVAVPVVLHLLAAFPSIARGVVMVQAEVADRMCAGPGSRVYGVPSAKLAWYAQARPAGTVPRSVFWPVPNVDSKLVAFTRHDPPVAGAARAEVFAVIDAAFGQRRKTLRGALSGWAGSPAAAERILRAAGVSPGARGESLGIAEFARIAQARTSPQDGTIQ